MTPPHPPGAKGVSAGVWDKCPIGCKVELCAWLRRRGIPAMLQAVTLKQYVIEGLANYVVGVLNADG